MNRTTKNIAVLAVAIVLFVFVVQEIFKAMELSLKDYPKYTKNPKKTTQQSWFDYVTPIAKAVGNEFGIPWQAIAVQSAVETGWGKSSLFTKYNNWGGIKAKKGSPSVQMQTVEFVNGQRTEEAAGFRVWKTPYEGLRGYAIFIHENGRYKKALGYSNDPYKYIVEIKKAGYATDPNYVASLHSLLNKYFA